MENQCLTESQFQQFVNLLGEIVEMVEEFALIHTTGNGVVTWFFDGVNWCYLGNVNLL